MADFGAILSGILGGVGQAGTALAAERQRSEEMARQKVRDALLERQVGLAERQYGEEQEGRLSLADAASRDPRLAPFASFFKVKGGEALAKFLADQVQRERRQRAGQTIAAGIPNADDTMEFTSPEEGAGMSPVPADPRARAVKAALESGDLDLKEALPFLFPKPTAVSETTTGFLDPRTGTITPVPGVERPAVVVPEGTRPEVAIDVRGRPSTTYKYPPERQPSASQLIDRLTNEYQTLLASGVPETDPRAKNLAQRINNQKLVPFEEGGGVRGPMGVVQPPSPKPPSPGERERLGDLDATIINTNNLVVQANQHRGVLGGLLSNPIGALRRAAGPYSATALTAEERKFLANFGVQVADLKRELIGKQQTIPEMKNLVDALPDKGNVDASVIATLEAIRDLMVSKRQALGNVLEQSNRKNPTPGAPAPQRTNDPLGIRR